jgi:hypothetical protein
VDAFDSDVLIYAAAPGHPLGDRVAALFPEYPLGSIKEIEITFPAGLPEPGV